MGERVRDIGLLSHQLNGFDGSKSRAFYAPIGLGNDRGGYFGERRASEVLKV